MPAKRGLDPYLKGLIWTARNDRRHRLRVALKGTDRDRMMYALSRCHRRLFEQHCLYRNQVPGVADIIVRVIQIYRRLDHLSALDWSDPL